MERERVVAVNGPGGRGSGYVIAPRLVLTSAHVIINTQASLTVFRPGRSGNFTARPVWCGTPEGRDDAALVLIDDPTWTPLPDVPLAWGRTVTHQPGTACQTWGLPQLVQREGRAPDIGQVTGTLNPGSRLVADLYELNLDSFPPEGDSPWAGMSGAAVFCGDLLAGVVAVDPAGRQHAALEAVPAYVLLNDTTFAEVVTEYASEDALRCEAIELQSLSDSRSHVTPGEPIRSPAALLTAHRAVVPFRGREDLLVELHAWAAQSGVGVWLLHGPGGQGKTRLAHEFATRLHHGEQAWATVWLDPAADAASMGVLAAVSSATLVVVDYAENRADQVAALFTVLARTGSTVAVKVLLLTRNAGAWWDELAATGGDMVRDIADLTWPRSLPVLDATPQGRDLTYRAAVSAFATALCAVPGLSDRPWAAVAAALPEPTSTASTVLAVQMSALADLLDAAASGTCAVDVVVAPPLSGPEDRVLAHERGYWKSTATAQGLLPGLTLATLTDVVITAAVLGPATAEDLGAVVARVPGMADQSTDRREAVRAWLMSVYPAGDDGAFEGLVPDRLAERLVGRSILQAGRTCVVRQLAPQASNDEAVRLLTVCIRAAAHAVLGPGVGDWVTRWCVEQAGTLAVAAVDVATRVEAPLPLVRAIEQIAAAGMVDTALLERVQDAFPLQSQVHSEAAAKIGQLLVDRRRQSLAEDPGQDGSRLALSLNNLAICLASLGREEEGLAAITEAVEIRRRLAGESPDAFLPDLAIGLNNLAICLGDLGRREEGLAAAMEAVEIRRRLAGESPDAFLPNLATSLNNLAIRLGNLGRREEGLAAITEAVEIRRRLAGESPDAFLPDLATSLNNLANRLGGLGRREEGLAAAMEAVTVYRRLAGESPDAFVPDVATSLNNLANRLMSLGRREEGLAAITEAVEIRRRLAGQRPDAFLSHLAASLNNLAVCLGGLGRWEEGLAAVTEAVEIRRRLAGQRPDAFLPDLAMSLNNLAISLGDLGREEEGLAAVTEAVTVYRELAEQRPDAFLPDLATSLNNLAIRLMSLELREQGLAAVTEAVEIYRELAKQRPDAFIPDLATSLNNLAVCLGGLGRWEEGLAAITEAVAIRRRLAGQRPDVFLPDLATSLSNLAIRLGDLGRREEGLVAIREAIETRGRLAEQQPATYLSKLDQSRRILAWLTNEQATAPYEETDTGP
ncbi:tetratricopeptide repeat protein [Amycolatopsis sp. RTGN1]|uniref:tetratricopeptide repeat protein n=1 Tax=Amycolatopsis ponsaeliensis TaxID=2992142 RepID=UPI0025513860|nr:tetratricopeptide repeat protein [Amycolatopsis sp. RTGN1]